MKQPRFQDEWQDSSRNRSASEENVSSTRSIARSCRITSLRSLYNTTIENGSRDAGANLFGGEAANDALVSVSSQDLRSFSSIDRSTSVKQRTAMISRFARLICLVKKPSTQSRPHHFAICGSATPSDSVASTIKLDSFLDSSEKLPSIRSRLSRAQNRTFS